MWNIFKTQIIKWKEIKETVQNLKTDRTFWLNAFLLVDDCYTLLSLIFDPINSSRLKLDWCI